MNPLIFALVLGAGWPAAQSPAIPEASGYVHIEGAPFTPTGHDVYKAVFDARQGAGKPGELLPALDMAASEINALAVEKVPLAHAQFVSNIVDYGMNVQAALEAPRFTKRSASGCDVSIESRVPGQTMQQLSERGHEIRIRREYTQEMGRGQAILHDSKTGTNYAASDPRADGSASWSL